MNCPNCFDTRLEAHDLEEDLVSRTCKSCDGHWVPSFQYWRWLDSRGRSLPEKPADDAGDLEVCDAERARICPECARILMRCKVGRGLAFYLDRCTHCGGIWFDRNEWAVLRSRNLHDDAHFVFSKSWQDRLIQEEKAAFQREWFIEKLGKEPFQEVERFREWLRDHEHRAAIIGYLEK